MKKGREIQAMRGILKKKAVHLAMFSFSFGHFFQSLAHSLGGTAPFQHIQLLPYTDNQSPKVRGKKFK